MIPYSFHPEAEAEIVDAALFYESRGRGLGRLFSAEVQRIVSLIREYPDAGRLLGCPFGELSSIGFHMPLSTDTIEGRFSFLPLRTYTVGLAMATPEIAPQPGVAA